MPGPIPPEQPKPRNQLGELRKRYEPIRSFVKKAVSDELAQYPKSDRQTVQRSAFRAAESVYQESKDLTEEARIDPLTGALSRGEIKRKLTEEAARMRRNGNKSSIAFLDVNDLKVVNDGKGGHDAGDVLLINTVVVLQSCGRETDHIGRYGGDEFVVILPGSNIDGAKRYWDRVNEEFTKKEIKISCGLTEIDHNDPEFSIAKADEAMYEAKRASKIAGVNTVVIHQEPKP